MHPFSALLLTLALAGSGPLPHDPERHLLDLEARLRAHPDDLIARRERALVLEMLGDSRRALADARAVLARTPGDAIALFVAARLEHELGEHELAAAHAALARTAGAPAAAVERLRGRALASLGRPQEAAAAFVEALRFANEPDPSLCLETADALRAIGADGEPQALAVLDTALARMGPVVSLIDAANDIDVHAGRFEHALRRLDPMRAFARRPEPWQQRVDAIVEAAHGDVVLPLPQPGVAARIAAPCALPTPLPPPPPVVLIPAGSIWRYDDTGTDLGTAFALTSFDDSGWASGPAQLGYGDGDEATVVNSGPSGAHFPTTYFRTDFVIAPGAVPQLARVRLLCDDGAAVFVNGVEVVHTNLPNGYHSYYQLASATISGAAESTWRTFAVPARLLHPGRNLIAVAVHQVSPTSSDISFDLEFEVGAGPAAIVRGPYLQDGTPNGGIVRWRTDQPTATQLWLSGSPTTLQLVHADPTPVLDHVVPLAGLLPDTTYSYACGDASGMLVGPAPELHLRTLPTPGPAQPVRIWALGDAGFATPSQLAVRDAYRQFAATHPADAIVFLGDNAYATGTDAEYQNGMFDVYGDELRNTFSWSTLGNHDAMHANGSTQTGVYFDVFSLPRAGEAGGLPSGTEAYYSFDRGHVHFVCLDSQDSNRAATGPMMAWLTADLAATTARWTIVFFHHPPYTFGSHNSDNVADSGGRMTDMRQVALPILEAAGVDLVLGGHSHSYERSLLLDGHYGASATLQPAMILDRGDGTANGDGTYAKAHTGKAPHEGAIYVVAGSAGNTSAAVLPHPAMYASFNQLGSLVLDVDGDQLDGRFVGLTGVEDHFTLVKGEARTLRRDQTGISVGSGGRQDLHLDAGSALAGRLFVLGTSAGTAPGFAIAGVHVPLNMDTWLTLSSQFANSAVYPNSASTLDANGRATTAMVLPPLNAPALVGQKLYHAALVFDAAGAIALVTNPVTMTFRP